MRIIQANCTIRYTGRCETFLPDAPRMIIIKDDGSVMIHVDSGIKPLNYMKASKELRFVEQDGHRLLHAKNNKEELFVDLLDILEDIHLPFPDSERDMVKTGTEDLLQEEIFNNLDDILGYTPVCREFETGKGPVDVFGMAEDKHDVALVEVKRKAHRKDVYQVLKYGDGIDLKVAEAREDGLDAVEVKQKGDNDGIGTMVPVEALANRKLYLASRQFARGTKDEAAEHNVGIIDMDKYEKTRGIDGTQGEMFDRLGAPKIRCHREEEPLEGEYEDAAIVRPVMALDDEPHEPQPEDSLIADNEIMISSEENETMQEEDGQIPGTSYDPYADLFVE